MIRSRRERYIGNLYKNYGNLLKAFLIRRYGSEDFANEVSQETFVSHVRKMLNFWYIRVLRDGFTEQLRIKPKSLKEQDLK